MALCDIFADEGLWLQLDTDMVLPRTGCQSVSDYDLQPGFNGDKNSTFSGDESFSFTSFQ